MAADLRRAVICSNRSAVRQNRKLGKSYILQSQNIDKGEVAMTYPCGIIRDLLPLYIDNVCNEESRRAVEDHLSECEKCRKYYEEMKVTEGFAEKQSDNSEDTKMADSLKNVKLRINKKIRSIALCAAAAVLAFAVGFNLLFNTALKEIPPQHVTVSAAVYPLEELAEASEDRAPSAESVTVFSDEDDSSEAITVKIPELGKVTLTNDTIEKCKYAAVVSVSSEYFIREIKQETKGDTVYISAFKTTLLNNKADDYQKTVKSLEFKEINRIVFTEDNGKETVLWSR